MLKPAGAIGAILALSACASQPPAFFKTACASETGERRYETPAPSGLAIPDDVLAFDALMMTGAEWVEYNQSAVYGPMVADFPEGPGRYRLSLTKLAEPECQEALRLEGYDPATRTRVSYKSRDGSYKGAMQACADAKRIGEQVDTFLITDGKPPTLQDKLKGWTAPYVFTFIDEVDRRSPLDAPVGRRVNMIVHRESGKPVVEDVGFSFMQLGFFGPRISVCGASPAIGRYHIPAAVFAEPT